MSRILIIIPTFNEALNIESIVGRVLDAEPDAHVLVVDDNSPDGTGDIAALLTADERVHLMRRAGKEGLGLAYLAGFHWGIDQGYDVLVEMDADGSHQPEQLERLLAAVDGGADLVLGSRWVPGGKVVNWSRHRELLSRGGNLYARIMLGIQLKDATGGYRAFRRSTLEGLNLREVASQGYCFQVDLARRSVEAGFDVVEVPITFIERTRGESKMSNAIVLEALWRVTVWGFARILNRR
ncbi:MAG: polyprenol monophosphomannose synthase [Actinomycetota bacterium]|nr:polyprenol monophosphomannose synthase [Actinomycetota bacterium]